MTITEFRKRPKKLNKSNKKTNVDKAFFKISVIDYFMLIYTYRKYIQEISNLVDRLVL